VGSFRLVTSNLLNGVSLADGRVDTDRMVRSLEALVPTVLALQEVDRHQDRSGRVDQTAAIAASIPGASWRFVPSLIGQPGASWRPATDADAISGHDLPVPSSSQAAFGTGLICALPVRRWHVFRVPAFAFRAPVFIPGVNRLMLIDDEPRVCLAAEVEVDGLCLTIASFHASFIPGWNVHQLRMVRRALAGLPAPRLLLGDLNLPGRTPSRVTGWSQLADGGPTFPSPAPKMQLDHVLLDDPGHRLPGRWAARVHRLDFSDHCAVSVEYNPPA
jgi:endonuclease/exonuclease/phosphatase family metal-dependent hydrolase